jgi:uncharacterized short protein YbdD (DUF466 family)
MKQAGAALAAIIASTLAPAVGYAKRLWQSIRQLTGDDAYEHYLAHWQAHHGCEAGQPMDRKTFFDAEQERKWSGVTHCC